MNIKKACYRSKQAYLTAEATPDPTDILISDMETDAQVVVSKDENDDTTCIAFRGTSSIVDWGMNSRLWLVPSQLDPQAMVHAGFFDAWESVKNEVYTAIDDNGMSKLILCGHSLGSGVAHVACTDIASKYPHLDMEVITFAGPRPGNMRFGIKCRERCPKMIRVVFDNDIVPNIPSMLLGYNHGDCDCLHLKEDGTFTFTNKDTNWVMELIRRIVKLFSFDIGIHDHDVQHYIDKLEMIDVDSEHFGTETEYIKSN
jgi:hypothetical protein